MHPCAQTCPRKWWIQEAQDRGGRRGASSTLSTFATVRLRHPTLSIEARAGQ